MYVVREVLVCLLTVSLFSCFVCVMLLWVCGAFLVGFKGVHYSGMNHFLSDYKSTQTQQFPPPCCLTNW